ncbi:hypothetical protein K7432_006183 [Basidiobolus ranarum]|uniref:Sodium/calcium exchanger membrane region domain-containing protein n=1 Tax=Basidiobolus ranarum TaxID=34480 RepID=A0ABR2WVE7_9FUNG
MAKSFIRLRLSLLIFSLLLLLSVVVKAQDIESFSESDVPCTHPSNHADPCAFVRAYCASEAGLINYLELRYCTISPQNAGWFFVLALFLTIAFFYALFRVSDVHLTTALQSISDYLGLSSEIAGLTLLSFGNGAPDLFTAFAGVSSGDFELVFGSTIGSAMFILNVVLGSIIIASYYRYRNESLSAPQKTRLELQQQLLSSEAELECRHSVCNSESFVRLRRKLQSITRALRLQPSDEQSVSNFVIHFSGISVDKFSHLRNLSIYTIAVFILLGICKDRTIRWFDPLILLLYYIIFLSFFIVKHFFHERTLRKKKEACLKLTQFPPELNSFPQRSSFDSVNSNLSFDCHMSRPDSTDPFLSAKPLSSAIPKDTSSEPNLIVPRLIVTQADTPIKDFLEESSENSTINGHQRHHLLRANRPNPIKTTRFDDHVIVHNETADIGDTSDQDAEDDSEDDLSKSSLSHIFSLLKLHLIEDSEIVNSIKERFRITKPTSILQWIKVVAELFGGIFWIFMIPIRCLIFFSMPPFLSDMISEVDDDIKEEDEDHLEEIAMNSENPEEYAEDALSTNIIRYSCSGDSSEDEKQPVVVGSERAKALEHTKGNKLSPSPSRLLTVPTIDLSDSIQPIKSRCSIPNTSIKCVRPSTPQKAFMPGGIYGGNTLSSPAFQTGSEQAQYTLVPNSTRSPDSRYSDYGSVSGNIRKAPWWWPLPRKAMIRFIYHLTHVPVHRFLKYRILMAVYPVVASLLVIYLAGFDLEGMSVVAIVVVAIVLIIFGLCVTREILTTATDFGCGFAEYLDAKSLLSPRSGLSSASPIGINSPSPSPGQSLNGEPISLSTDEKNIARYLKFLHMAYSRGAYSESNPCHIPFHSIKVATMLYLYELFCSFITFFMSILWIYLVSNEIVALLASLGTILSLSKAIIGLTVLAWGNSLGDLFADVAMARAGFFRVAFTAVWAGPIQNLLLTLGITLLIACIQHRPMGAGLADASIPLPPISSTIWLGFAFLLFSVLILSGALLAIYYKFRLPLSLGILLIANFVVYLTTSIIVELSTDNP